MDSDAALSELRVRLTREQRASMALQWYQVESALRSVRRLDDVMRAGPPPPPPPAPHGGNWLRAPYINGNVVPCGGGKTWIALLIMACMRGCNLVLCPQRAALCGFEKDCVAAALHAGAEGGAAARDQEAAHARQGGG